MERDLATKPGAFGLRMNVLSRTFELERQLRNMRDSISNLKDFQRQCEAREFTQDITSDALYRVKQLMRALDVLEYVFPELSEKYWFGGFQSDVHHAYWRIEDNRFDGVLDLEAESLDSLCSEIMDILSNISDSPHTNPVDQLSRFIEHYGQEINPYEAPDEYENEVFEARDLSASAITPQL